MVGVVAQDLEGGVEAQGACSVFPPSETHNKVKCERGLHHSPATAGNDELGFPSTAWLGESVDFTGHGDGLDCEGGTVYA